MQLMKPAPKALSFEVPRSRLLGPDAASASGPSLIALFAPAGYGKSTLMGQWTRLLHENDECVCWLSLVPRHKDAKQLLSDLFSAFQDQTGITFDTGTQKAVQGASSFAYSSALATLLQGLAEVDQNITIFLDEFEAISESDGAVLLRSVVDLLPSKVKLVVAGRDPADLPLMRYRLANRVTVIGPDDLRFTNDEARQILLETHDLTLSEDSFESLMEKTEGWPAALQMFALGVGASDNPEKLLSAFSGASSTELSDYLNETVFNNLDRRVINLAMLASVPAQLGLDLFAWLAGDSAASVEDAFDILRNKYLLKPVGPGSHQFRFHSLVSSYLRKRLKRTNLELWQEALNKTADWHWNKKHYSDSIEYCVLGKRWSDMAQRVADISEHVAREQGQHATYLSWVRQLPQDEMDRYPELYLHQAWALDFSRQSAESESCLNALENLLSRFDPARANQLAAKVDLQRFVRAATNDVAHKKVDDIQKWLYSNKDANPYDSALARITLASGLRNSRRCDQAIKILDEIESIQSTASDYTLYWAHIIRISTLIRSGRMSDARAFGRMIIPEAEKNFGVKSSTAGMLNAQMGYLQFENDNLEEAKKLVDKGLQYVDKQGVVEPLFLGTFTQSQLIALDGNFDLAVATLEEGEQYGIRYQLPRLTLQLAARRALMYIYGGHLDLARSVMENRGLLEFRRDEYFTLRMECSQYLRASMEIAKGCYLEASERLANLCREVESNGLDRMLQEYRFALAIALHGEGKINPAGRMLKKVLIEAALQGRWRFMLFFGAIARPVVSEFISSGTGHTSGSGRHSREIDALLKNLAEGFGLSDGASENAEEVENSVQVGLSNRELEILQFASKSGLNNKELAAALFLSRGTLKWHLHNIYKKLEVKNRAGAIAHAQRAGLI